jgi:superfamily II DNA/RNA helicase
MEVFCVQIQAGISNITSYLPFVFIVLLLVPTRELALQTSQVCKELSKHLNIQIMVTTGGTSLKDDIMRLYQPVHILVATPGRVLDLTKKGVCDLSECGMLVMDEVWSICIFIPAVLNLD